MRVNIKSCVRCGEDHQGLEFNKLTRPMPACPGEPEFTYFATCPTLQEPVLLDVRVVKDQEPEKV